MEDGEVKGGFLGEKEMAERKALAAAHGEGSNISWVEAVILGAGHVSVDDGKHLRLSKGDTTGEQGEGATSRAVVTSVDGSSAEANAATAMSEEPPPPGTSADRPPLPPSALVRRETALVHRVMALLGEADPASSTLISLLAEAEADGVDVPRWLDLGRSSNRGRTPLMEAAMQGQTVCVAALAEAACAGGRGLNARNERGRYSALHYACYYGAAGAALELLVRGADPRLRNQEGETALQAALANGRTECAELVRDFLRRPTFEPDSGGPFFLSTVPVDRAAAGDSKGSNRVSVAKVKSGGVTAVAPEVSRANTVFCLGRRRRRLGPGIRPGRGLGVGVGTTAAEVALGARRGARLHAINPCFGTPMEAYALWAIPNGQDPFGGEGRGGSGGGAGIGIEDGDDEVEDGWEGENRPKGTSNVWLEYYVRIYNASVRRWHSQQDAARDTDRVRTSSVGERVAARAAERKHGTQTKPAAPAAKQSCGEVEGRAEGESEEDDEEDEDGSAYALVVKESKAQEKGSQFELPCGSSVVVGRSQSRAGIVIKDELVSKEHLRVEVSAVSGLRVCDLGSKHGAVITKPAPPRRESPVTGAGATPGTRSPAAESARDKKSISDELPESSGKSASEAAGDAAVTPKTQDKPKFFPIPVPREPEWVPGAHGDRIILGKTTLQVKREDGPRPPTKIPARRHRKARKAMSGAKDGDGTAERKRKKPAAIISKVFEVNPNLLEIIRSAEEFERAQKRKAVASEMAAAAAAEYLAANNKRVRSSSRVSAAASESRAPVPSTVAATTQEAGGEGKASDDENKPSVPGDFEHVSVGNKLLKRMGWTEGQGLGRRSDGQLQPVQVERRGEREGLGTVQAGSSPYAVGADGRISKWEQMRRRFTQAQSKGPGYGGAKRTGASKHWLRGGVEGGNG